MEKNEILEKVLSKEFTELVPVSFYEGNVYNLNSVEFYNLRKHLNLNYSNLNSYNIITIENNTFIRKD